MVKNQKKNSLTASCVIVVCSDCEGKGDIREMMTKLRLSADKAAIETQVVKQKMEKGLAEVRKEVAECIVASKRVEKSMLELETLKTSVHKHEAIPERLATGEEALSTLKTSVAENKNEWTEIVKKNKSAKPTTAGLSRID